MRGWLAVGALLLGLYIAYSCRDTFQSDSLRGKRVLLTGASSGIGEQMAYHYAKLGVRLVITARTETRLQKVVSRCREVAAPGAEFHYVIADMADVTAYQRVTQEAASLLGGLDYLVLNHILTVPLGDWYGKPENLTLLQTLFDVNFRAYVHLASHAVPLLEESGGSIVVVSSVAGKIGMPYTAAYSGSKFALDGFFSALRQELRLRGSPVAVTLCVIGFIGTDNAVAQMRTFGLDFLIDTLNPSSPEDAALAIIKGGASRAREIYFPYAQARFSILARDWAAGPLEAFIRYMYAKP